jgi:hypothetical protein
MLPPFRRLVLPIADSLSERAAVPMRRATRPQASRAPAGLLQSFELEARRQRLHLMPRGEIQQPHYLALLVSRHSYANLQAR